MTRLPRAGRTRGAATLLVAAVVGVLLVVAVALAGTGRLLIEHRRAQAAADLAALAGAVTLARGGDPCGTAAGVAGANGARLTSCSSAGAEVLVETEVALRLPTGHSVGISGRARAGP